MQLTQRSVVKKASTSVTSVSLCKCNQSSDLITKNANAAERSWLIKLLSADICNLHILQCMPLYLPQDATTHSSSCRKWDQRAPFQLADVLGLQLRARLLSHQINVWTRHTAIAAHAAGTEQVLIIITPSVSSSTSLTMQQEMHMYAKNKHITGR